MYDIHCHILPEVDDGPLTIAKAVEIAKAAEQNGVKAIVCTPHYIDGVYKNSADDNLIVLKALKKAVELKGIGLQLHLGNEVLITPDIIELLDTSRIKTLNNSRYILIEMPIHSKPLYTDDIIFKLKLRGLVPIIAHPERYEWVNKNPKELRDIISKGCLTQLNIASINGYYGTGIVRSAKTLLKENYIHLLGSDSHISRKIYNSYKNDLILLQRFTSECTVKQMIENAEAVINNKAIKNLYNDTIKC